MADITKCTNAECLLKDGCYRWTAPANEHWQSVCRFELDDQGNCGMMIATCGCGVPDKDCLGDCEYWKEKDLQ